MAMITPVAGKVELVRRLGACFGVTFPFSKLVIEADVNSYVKVYVVAPADVKGVEAVCGYLETIRVADVAVDDGGQVSWTHTEDTAVDPEAACEVCGLRGGCSSVVDLSIESFTKDRQGNKWLNKSVHSVHARCRDHARPPRVFVAEVLKEVLP